MANTTLTVDVILKEAQRIFKNETSFLQSMDRQYDRSYEAHGAKEGDTIRIKQPQRYSYRTGKTVDVQDNVENSVSLARSSQGGVDLKFSSKELTLDISRFSELYLRPAMQTIASNVENTILQTAYKSVYNAVTLPTTALDRADLINAGTKLDLFSAPRGGMARFAVLNPEGQGDLVNDSSSLFNPSANISRQYLTGAMGNAYGFEVAMSQNIPGHTVGTQDGAYLMSAAGTEGASTISVDTGTGTILEGDILTIAGVNAVNRVTGADTGVLQQFVVTADYAGGAGDISISPSLTTVGAYKTISALPANNAAVTVLGTANTAYPQNLAFHKQAFAFATVDLEIPKGANVGMSGRSVEDGVSIRMVEFYDGINDDSYYRLDILYGFVAVTPEWACRIYGV